MLVAVLLVQQVEGSLLQPLVVGRAVALHPLVVLVAVASGSLLLGVVGAVVAVPLVAVTYRVSTSLTQDGPPATSPAEADDQEAPDRPAHAGAQGQQRGAQGRATP